MTHDQFITRYPEFSPADVEFPGMIDAAMAEAMLAVSDQWGAKTDQVIGLETAHRLAITPFGRTAKLSSSLGKSTYGNQLCEMRIAFACGLSRMG